jgi:GTP-binding protein
MVVATKIDALDEPERLEALRIRAQADGREFFAVSSVTGEGVKLLLRALANEVEQHRAHKLLPVPDDVRAGSHA